MMISVGDVDVVADVVDDGDVDDDDVMNDDDDDVVW